MIPHFSAATLTRVRQKTTLLHIGVVPVSSYFLELAM